MNEDGTMARMPELQVFAKEHDLKIITIKDLIAYRLKKESLIEIGSSADLPTTYVIRAEGLTSEGRIVSGELQVEVIER